MIGYRLQKLRKEKNLTLEELANQLEKANPGTKFTKGQISKWENNKETPMLLNAKKIADFFNITIDSLLSDNLVIEQTAPSWATSQDKLQLLDFLNGNLGFNIGPRELTEEEDRKMKEIMSTLFWDDLKELKEDNKLL